MSSYQGENVSTKLALRTGKQKKKYDKSNRIYMYTHDTLVIKHNKHNTML